MAFQTVFKRYELKYMVIILGSNAPSIKTEASADVTLDENGVVWN